MQRINRTIFYSFLIYLILQFCSCQRKAVNIYLGCYHCEITDSKFEEIRNENIYHFHNHPQLTSTEYARTVLRSSYEYDNYIVPGRKITPQDSSNITKLEYIDSQIIVFEKIKKYKLKKWNDSIQSTVKKPNWIQKAFIPIYLKYWL